MNRPHLLINITVSQMETDPLIKSRTLEMEAQSQNLMRTGSFYAIVSLVYEHLKLFYIRSVSQTI